MTIDQQEEVDRAFQKVVEQRNKDYKKGVYWQSGIRQYLIGSDNSPKEGFLLINPPVLNWMK